MNDFLQSEDSWLLSPWAWAMVTGALALWCLVPRGRLVRWQIAAGGVLGVVSVGLARFAITDDRTARRSGAVLGGGGRYGR